MTVKQARIIINQFKAWEHGFEGRTRILTGEYLEAEKVMREAARIPQVLETYYHREGDCTCLKCKKKFFDSMTRPALIAISRAAYRETSKLLKSTFEEGLYWLVSNEKKYRLEDTMNGSISMISECRENISAFF